MRVLILVNLLSIFAFGVEKEFTLGGELIEMPSEGIEFKAFKSMKAVVMKPLKTEVLVKNGNEQIEVYDIRSLWLRDQKLATYENSKVKMEFYKLNYLPPDVKPFWKNYIQEADFQKAITEAKWNTKGTLSWLKEFHNKKVTLRQAFPRLTNAIKQAWVAYGQDKKSYDLLIVSKDNLRLYYFRVQTTSDMSKFEINAINQLVRTIRLNKPKAVNSSSDYEIGKMTAKYEATLKRVIQEVGNNEDWWYAKTANYVIKSNMRFKDFVEKVQVRVELMRKVYEGLIPPEKAIDDISVITLPKNRDEYLKYAEAESWSAGVWNPGRKELIVSNQLGPETMSTLHHEAFHQYIFYALNRKVTPPWFNEGHAELFSSVEIKGKSVTVKENTRAFGIIKNILYSGKFKISDLINADYKQFYSDKKNNYALAWSLVYFLRKAGPLYEAEGYDQIVGKLLDEMKLSGSMKLATKKAFEGINLEEFQKDFLEFWDKDELRAKALETVLTSKK